MITLSLQSGSTGNCIYIEANGTSVLIDAGITGVLVKSRLAEHGFDVRSVDAILISHDHVDHVRYAGVLQRKFSIPVYASHGTWRAAQRKVDPHDLGDARTFRPGKEIRVGAMRVETIPTPHDGTEGVGFVVEAAGTRLGVLTDLGHPFPALYDTLRTLDAVFLESNYDPEMLENGPYPAHLKKRIQGPQGHLSNYESADLLSETCSKRMQWACLAHLSETNNDPELALRVNRSAVGPKLTLYAASRYDTTGVFKVLAKQPTLFPM